MPLKSARFKNFTSVPSTDFHFSPGVNIIVGENGSGKSHVLKAIYSLMKVQATTKSHIARANEIPPLSVLEKQFADRLVANLRPETLGRLVKRRQGTGKAEIGLKFSNGKLNLRISFATRASTQVVIDKAHSIPLDKLPVFFPTRELITLSGWFGSLYDSYHLEFEEIWRDTVSLLNAPAIRGPKEERVRELLEPIEVAMDGKVEVDQRTGRFYLRSPAGRMEMPLVAEGLRKFAMLARMISAGVLLEHGYLFWDEPETNLNPKLIRVLARTIMKLAEEGIQIFIASHSLILLKEIEILQREDSSREKLVRFFSIEKISGEDNSLSEGGYLYDIEPIVALDEEISQADIFLRS
ncbi:AAA family ATPase [Jannaschia donghaensis]|uniref:Chromosome segregation protein n=1 Tax=Jannaschia donghaensis TaxID=420998 RepID=A0A0M6YIT5_9RHOB|nr:AAA family ATPase [Jannaschia donghaensis]CTQ49834.1 chromosome segregation protein [Jannaschia donghaensis]